MLALSVSFSNTFVVGPVAPASATRVAAIKMVEPSNLDLNILDKYMSLPVQGKIQVSACRNQWSASLASKRFAESQPALPV